ncbi:MAG: pilus assembly protein [Silicimonas sp.]|nr:pilus assembly protein [Silicimonas sp.]
MFPIRLFAESIHTETKARIAKFRAREDGNATVEIVLWVPFFFILLMGVGQLALIFFGQTVALSAAQNATRAYSVGDITTQDEIRTFVEAELAGISTNVTVTSTITNGLITTFVSVPAGDLGGPLGFITQFGGMNIQSIAQQFKET